MTAPIPLTVITGFLGSGKTTLLSHLLRDPALQRTAVIINEFGAVGLDHLLVEASEEDIVQLDGGCLCCTVRGDLVRTVGDLLARRADGSVQPFERIVVETSGLADPAPILQAVMTDPLLAEAVRVAGVVTTVDGLLGAETLARHAESVKQAAVADRLVITKTDVADPAKCGLEAALAQLNPGAARFQAAHGRIDATALFGPELDVAALAARLSTTDAEVPHAHDHGIHSFVLRRSAPVHAVALTLFLQMLAEHCGPDLLRVKGLVDVVESPDRPAVIHGVQHVFHPPAWRDGWPDADRSTRIVFIARKLPEQWPGAVLEILDAEVAAVQSA